MNKEQFYRGDYNTFKPKYYLFCRQKEFKLEKFESYVKNPYIRRITVKEI
jgi:hypothetical protein